ncbi:hypothetical protein Leryth_022862 [Lithospermum erythrorhizon]|nr:hypothetical protein Leryth_022862 [Lithospermum erythrorhizon]
METKEIQEFIFKSPLPDITLKNHLPLHTYIFQNISQFRSSECLINSVTGEIFTYDDVEVATKKVATGFRNKLGIQKGDVIMILLHNSL